jgi:IS30 family transposase
MVYTFTSENGKEFAEHEQVAVALKADFYFANHTLHLGSKVRTKTRAD